jgi:DNA-directed RNA polymerase specialized sigma24 family protein
MAAHEWEVRTEEGFLACYCATLPEVYRYAAMLCGHDRALAEDVVQDVYLTALGRARDGSLTTLTAGYLCVAARHRHLDRLRSFQREQRRLQLVASEPDVPAPRIVPPPQLAAMPERERTALVLRYVDDLSVAQVGRELSISTHAAESLLARATRRIRQQEVRDA